MYPLNGVFVTDPTTHQHVALFTYRQGIEGQGLSS